MFSAVTSFNVFRKEFYLVPFSSSVVLPVLFCPWIFCHCDLGFVRFLIHYWQEGYMSWSVNCGST